MTVVDDNEEYCYKGIMKCLSFLLKQGGDVKDKYNRKNGVMRNDLIDIHDIYGRIKVKTKAILEEKTKGKGGDLGLGF